ncbi:MAG: GTPase Era [Caldilineaceae bacterium]|nr:GTPase Era [Caldilineaceae bacterium]
MDLILPAIDELPADHRSGFVAVIGRPNVGKSTLFNRVLEQKIAITSPKPQTTRDQVLGIYTTDAMQVIFLDTPGIHEPQHRLGEYMMGVVAETLADADLVLWLVDVNTPPTAADLRIAEQLRTMLKPQRVRHLVLGLNKLDQLGDRPQVLAERRQEYRQLVDWFGPVAAPHDSALQEEAAQPAVTLHVFSGLTGQGVDDLLATIQHYLPLGPRYYPEDQVTDLQVRFIVEELIREKALELLSQEVPHSIAVEIDEFSLRNENMTYISAVIYLERESQKKIVLGAKGSMIKRIGQAARPEIEDLVGTKVYLELWVKVWEKWRKRAGMLRRLGYAL